MHYIQYYTLYIYLLHAFYSILYTVHLSDTCIENTLCSILYTAHESATFIIFNTIHCTLICYMHYIQYYTLYIYLLTCILFNTIHCTFICYMHYIQYCTCIIFNTVHMYTYINLLHALYSILYTVHLSATCIENTLYSILYTVH